MQEQAVNVGASETAPISPLVRPYLAPGEMWRRPLPYLAKDHLTRFLTRLALQLYRRHFLEVRGAERLKAGNDPYIVVLNHSQRSEAILIPGLLFFLRDGKRVHFMADWNFCLFPPVAILYRCAQVITLVRKPAKPKFLNIFKPLFVDKLPAFERARQRLAEGAPVGIFPEGTVNRNPKELLKGFYGAAQLSLETGVPLLPVGVRFPTNPEGQPIQESSPQVIEIGEPLVPEKKIAEPTPEEVRAWHARMMEEISRLSGKTWKSNSKRK
ncbi:MAG TPA: 1-acyl-sn-glycerol-3-phosphate acyltransferase [Verrucomicrobiae bacterium]